MPPRMKWGHGSLKRLLYSRGVTGSPAIIFSSYSAISRRSRRMDESPAGIARSLRFILVESVLALDTTRRPWHGREALGADRRFAVNAGSKAAVGNAPQCGFHVAQQLGLTIHVSNRQIPFRRILNLVHFVGALLDCDAVPLAQHVNQLGLFSLQNILEPTHPVIRCLHGHPLRPPSRLKSFARDGPELTPAHWRLAAAEPEWVS